jgi:predicted nucleic acid-binding protein
MIFLDTSAIFALADQADPQGKRRVSLVDQVSFLVMRRRGARTAMAFDRDFEEEGFKLYPAGT